MIFSYRPRVEPGLFAEDHGQSLSLAIISISSKEGFFLFFYFHSAWLGFSILGLSLAAIQKGPTYLSEGKILVWKNPRPLLSGFSSDPSSTATASERIQLIQQPAVLDQGQNSSRFGRETRFELFFPSPVGEGGVLDFDCARNIQIKPVDVEGAASGKVSPTIRVLRVGFEYEEIRKLNAVRVAKNEIWSTF